MTIRDIESGTILARGTLIEYLYYVRTQELMMPLAPFISPTLAQACELIIKLLTRSCPILEELPANPIFTLSKPEYIIQSPFILDYEDPGFPDPDLARYDSVAYWHGGIVGLNEAHFGILTMLSRISHRNAYGIIIGFEGDEYLATKGRDTLRPWELIVTVSIFCHLAQIYRIPLKVFIMPPFPGQGSDLEQHYMDIYRRVLRGNPNTPIVITLGDKYCMAKKERMRAVGLKPNDWNWTNLKLLYTSPSTSKI